MVVLREGLDDVFLVIPRVDLGAAMPELLRPIVDCFSEWSRVDLREGLDARFLVIPCVDLGVAIPELVRPMRVLLPPRSPVGGWE